MTASELIEFCRRLSNMVWCRYWLLWGYPQMPARMAISLKDHDGRDIVEGNLTKELTDRGFVESRGRGSVYWVIERTNPDGSPFEW